MPGGPLDPAGLLQLVCVCVCVSIDVCINAALFRVSAV